MSGFSTMLSKSCSQIPSFERSVYDDCNFLSIVTMRSTVSFRKNRKSLRSNSNPDERISPPRLDESPASNQEAEKPSSSMRLASSWRMELRRLRSDCAMLLPMPSCSTPTLCPCRLTFRRSGQACIG